MAKKKTKHKKNRATSKKNRIQAQSSNFGNGGKALASASLAKPSSELGLLRQIFNLVRGSAITKKERMQILSDLEKRVAQSGVNPKNFGVKSETELAELFVKIIERMKIKPKSFRAFIAQMRIKGYQSRVRGMLWHMFVRNFQPLQDDFIGVARSQVKEMNNPAVKLLNAKGKGVQEPVNFGKPRKAQEIHIIKNDGTSVEFIDDVLVSCSGAEAKRLWGFLVEIEVKTTSAAKSFSKQIGFAQLRLMADEVKEVAMIVEGFKEVVKIKPENIIFSPSSIDRNAVTLLSNSKWGRLAKSTRSDLSDALTTGNSQKIYEASGFRFQSTRKGQGETFRRITLAVNTDELNKLVRAIWPSVR